MNSIKRPHYQPKRTTFKNKMGIRFAALAIALGIGTYAISNTPKDLATTETYSLGLTKDILDDKYINSIPVFADKETKKLLKTIGENVLVISQESLSKDKDASSLISVIDKATNEIVSGYMKNIYISNIVNINKNNITSLYKVTSNNGVNLRTQPEVADNNKIVGIPQNAILLGGNSQVTNKKEPWTKVLYYNGNSLNEGFTSSKHLEKIAHTITKDADKKSPQSSSIDYTTVNDDEVLGIDVSDISPERLEQLLTGKVKIPKTLENKKGKKIDFSNYDNRKINFVYIKLMASSAFSENLKKGVTTRYKKLAEICEKHNVPFGFYYYSTCKDKNEASIEHKWISEALGDLPKSAYNLLPLAIDVEVANNKDRQNSVSVEKLTEAKTNLANLIENDFGKTILYTSRNACDNTLQSKILDIEQYQNGLYSGNSHIWFVAPPKSKNHNKSLDQISEHVQAKQVALDIKTDKKRYNVIDINVIKEDAFKQYISGEYKNFDRFIVRDKMMYTAQNDEYER